MGKASVKTENDVKVDEMDEDLDIVSFDSSETSGQQSKQNDFEMWNKPESKEKYKIFIREQSFELIMDKIIPFCLDFDGFIGFLQTKEYKLYDDLMQTLNVVLIHFI